MTAQQSGTGAFTELKDEQVRKDDILSNRDRATRRPDDSLDSTGVQVDEYKDIPTNQRPKKRPKKDAEETSEGAEENVDRPGFDLGGTTGETEAGKGLGLGTDAKEGRKGWGLPR
jgi:hypothetical protein